MTVIDPHARRRSPARQARIRLASEGVVASYIHDISTPRVARRRTLEDPSRSVPGVGYRLDRKDKVVRDAEQSGHRP